MDGKKHLLNRWRRDPSKPIVSPYRSPSPGKRGVGETGKFKIDVTEALQISAADESKEKELTQEQQQVLKTPRTGPKIVDTSNALQPKPRAMGGIWLTQSDFPHAF